MKIILSFRLMDGIDDDRIKRLQVESNNLLRGFYIFADSLHIKQRYLFNTFLHDSNCLQKVSGRLETVFFLVNTVKET